MWWACEQPERPPDVWVRWHYFDCRACQLKAEAQAQRFPNDPHVRWLNDMLGCTGPDDEEVW